MRRSEYLKIPIRIRARFSRDAKISPRAEYIDESHVLASDWNSALRVTRPVSGGVKYIGLRTHYMHPSMGQRENVIVCDVLQAIEDLHEMILLLQCGDSIPLILSCISLWPKTSGMRWKIKTKCRFIWSRTRFW